MKNIGLLLILNFFVVALIAQPTIQWQKALGGSDFDEARSIQQTSDGGYIVTGTTSSSDGDIEGFHGAVDCWVVKLDVAGSIVWSTTIGGSDQDWPYSVRQTQNGGFIIVGFTGSNDGDISGNHGDYDALVVKLSNTGEIEWNKTLGGSGWDEAWSVELTSDGGYIVSGRSNSNDGDALGNPGGSLDYWIIKLDSQGSVQWQKALGGSDEDTARSIKQTSDGGYIIAGDAKSNDGDVQDNNGNVDFWIVKLDSTGEIEWQNALGGSGVDVAREVIETSDGFVAFGYVGSHNSGDVTGHHALFDFWIAKLNKTGALLWQKTLGGSDGDWLYAGSQTNDGGFILTGPTRSLDGDVMDNIGGQDIWVLKLNNEGDVLWQKTLGGTRSESSFSIQQTNDFGFILAGFSLSDDVNVSGNHGENDFWVVKLSPETVNIQSPQPTPLNLYPNPAHESISITTAYNDPIINITITDLLGRNCLQQSAVTGGLLDIGTLPKGLFLVLATGESGKVYVGKLRKE